MRLIISFSGGETSAYMANVILNDLSIRSRYEDIVTVFANTGQEREETLDFVDKCDKHFGLNVVWLEAVVHNGTRKGTTHSITSYIKAERNGKPFEDVIRKYGIPNQAFHHCTRELKIAPINSYVKSLGWYGRPAKLETVLDHVGAGWHPLVRTLIVDLFAAGWDGQLTQIKEKFGGLRFYIGSGSDEVHALTSKAEDDSFRICEECGDAGECRYDIGWYRTLCDKHYHEIIDMAAPTRET